MESQLLQKNIDANDFVAMWTDIESDVMEAVQRVGKSGWYILGSEVESFENALAAVHGVEYVVGCASGLDAIEIGLRCAGIGPGDRVLTTPLTAFATVLAVVRSGATPVFVDVDENGLLDLTAAERSIREDPEINAIVPVHLYGQVLDMDSIREIAEREGCAIVEDAAQAICGTCRGRPVGSDSVAAATSFYPTKNLGALGDGGAILTNDSTVADAARRFRDYGQKAKYEHVVAGLNSRLDEIHAAILRTAFLPRLQRALSRRSEIARRYTEEITHTALTPLRPRVSSTWHIYPVFVQDPALRESLISHLRARRIGSAVHYPFLASAQPALDEPIPADAFPIAQRISECEVSLPIHAYLSDSDVDYVIASVNEWKP